MAMRIPSRCPACDGELVVHALRCLGCGTEIEGAFVLSRFLLLDDEQLRFCELIIRFRGNLKEVCAELGISYPTARNRMNDLIKALGFDDGGSRVKNIEILDRLAEGAITHEQAVEMLNDNR